MKLDHNYVPPRRDDYMRAFWSTAKGVEDLAEDAPIVTFLRLLLQQIIGFPWYLMVNITAAPTSLPKKPSSKMLGNSHFAPWGSLFRNEEVGCILASDMGLAAMAALLFYAGQQLGSATVVHLYLTPYLWTNHWIVAITYLHHTHPDLPKYEPEAWTFIKGATATMDRSCGFIGRFFFHDILDYHVVHHLFSRIPCYHLEEASKAVIPLMGDMYHSVKDRSFVGGFWESFTKCQWVEPNASKSDPKDGSLWYKGGPSPPPEIKMAQRG
ncbi:MAG: hypothetical protein LQ340_003502, partial [Diploschistes diacapsis]